ncbi:hypothetical protein AL714_17965 [Clostridium botulinum]|uniref:hypothetical protein n=1 Tax=Clostridium botulinum TaxID=1491 RepID=UPI00099D58AF|nr:hypothetical protein [Clostridium botulinum]OPD33713.1 hypothetical protein AL714_17965 [Clostridium botulinum]
MELNKLRWEALSNIGLPYIYVKNYINKNFKLEVSENSFEELSQSLKSEYDIIDEYELLFELEDIAYKKIALFSLRDKEKEELENVVFRENFLKANRLFNTVNNKKVKEVDEVAYPSYIKFGDDYIIIKISQLRHYQGMEVDDDNTINPISKTYYHSSKFIIDLKNSLVALFYNDIQNELDDGNTKAKAITEKKQAFYSLFSEGNQNTLLKFNIEPYINKYIKNYLECLESNKLENCQSVIVIETSDPIELKNNLRSSKKDGRHNEYRLKAIKYALEHEEHTVKTMESIIANRWFQFKSYGEIVSSIPYLSREVIESVCEELFPNYKITNY